VANLPCTAKQEDKNDAVTERLIQNQRGTALGMPERILNPYGYGGVELLKEPLCQ
jgi:hypothetical protein